VDKGTHTLEGTKEGPVRTVKESKQARGTHFLESGDGETSQITKRKRMGERHLRTGEYRGWDKSGQQKGRSKDTHKLETMKGWTGQDWRGKKGLTD
jgi:hypothetical protein